MDVLIGDDCSTDGTADIINTVWENEPRITLVSWRTPSGSAGANFRRLYCSADASAYDFVALADQDDIWFPDKLSRAITRLHMHDAQGYSCAVESFWPDGRSEVLAQNPHERGADYLFEGAGQGCTFVVTRALFQQVQSFCKQYPEQADRLHYHDWLIYLLARRWQLRWHFDPRPGMRYRQHGGNEIGSRGSLSAVTRRLALIRNGWYNTQVKAALAAARAIPMADDVLGGANAMLSSSDTPMRRMRMIGFVLRHGRRKAADRALLAVASGCGWI